MNCEDTIVNLATPMGTGAISVIRCSGENVLEISKIFLDKKLEPRYAHYAKFKNKNNVVIDDVVVIFYEGPRSYTGENMIEIMCHGGPVIYQLLIKEILKMNGCRLAKAGEFSERAFLNNKMSLFEAEATCALINAKTEEAALAARESLSGKLSQDLLIIDNALLKTRIQVEALLDFSEEDIETDGLLTIEEHINDCKKKIHILVERLEKNRLLFETSKIAIIGKPNSGKSSLINLLTNDAVSIVNKAAGTTRDIVTKMFNLGGMPITIFDTAGIRETSNLIEKEGKEKALEIATRAHVVLYLYDVSLGINKDDLEILNFLKEKNICILIVANKIDLATNVELKKLKEQNKDECFVSIKNDIGLGDLKNKIIQSLNFSINNSSPGVIQIQHISLLKNAYDEISKINVGLAELEIIAEKLKSTQENIANILNNNDDDRVLSGIFSNFCIGK